MNNRVQGNIGRAISEIFQNSNRNEFEIGQGVDFCDASGVWVNAKSLE